MKALLEVTQKEQSRIMAEAHSGSKELHDLFGTNQSKGGKELEPHLGDASAAAPFTSKYPSIYAAVHLIRHGRAAHAQIVNNQRSTLLECILLGYCLSELYLKRVKFGIKHTMIESTLRSFISQGQTTIAPLKSLEKISAIPRSAFLPKYIFSLAINVYLFVSSQNAGLKWLEDYNKGQKHEDTEKVDGDQQKSISDVAKATLSMFSSFKPHMNSNFVLLSALLQVALLPWIHHLGRPFTQDLHYLPAIRGPILLTLGIIIFLALVEQPQGPELSRLADFLQIAQVPPVLCLKLTILLAATAASVVGVDAMIRQSSPKF